MELRGAPWPGAVAVSGGGDSLALMLLLADWATMRARPLPVVLTVDHGLRPESLRNARDVIKRAEAKGLQAHILLWRGRKPSSDVEAVAREARYRLMGAWCRAQGVTGLYVAHTIDDQAETFLLRLARGSGVDGLSAMASVSAYPSPDCESLFVVRPLLSVSRVRLRRFLEARGETWTEDVMNADPRFARTRLRTVWPVLEGVGLSAARIAAAAGHLARAREVLDQTTQVLLANICRVKDGRMFIDGGQLAGVPEEIGLRALSQLLMDVSGNTYRPRFERLVRLFGEIRGPGGLRHGRTLHGCRVAPAPKRDAVFGASTLAIAREPRRAPSARARKE